MCGTRERKKQREIILVDGISFSAFTQWRMLLEDSIERPLRSTDTQQLNSASFWILFSIHPSADQHTNVQSWASYFINAHIQKKSKCIFLTELKITTAQNFQPLQVTCNSKYVVKDVAFCFQAEIKFYNSALPTV